MKKNLIPIAVLTGVGIYYARKVYLDFQKFKAEREKARQDAKRDQIKAMLNRVVADITGEDHSGHEHDVWIKVVEIDGPPTREKLLASLGEFLDQVPGLDADDEAREKFSEIVDGTFGEHVAEVDLVGQVGDPNPIQICRHPGHQGEEVLMLGGRCPDRLEHYTLHRDVAQDNVVPLRNPETPNPDTAN
jgi:hypothetical protein